MASTLVLVLQLFLVSLASASHQMGGTTGVIYRGKNPDGTVRLDFRYRNTFETCEYGHFWSCLSGECGVVSSDQRSYLDSSLNAPPLETGWCEAEVVERRNVPTDEPFAMWAESCCWISTRNSVSGWRLLTFVDLGTRSDTREPNRSPDIAIIPFLRVPYNCPRTYKLISFDPDGDKVRCRYGNIQDWECSRCDRPFGFYLDENSCTLQYNQGTFDLRVYAFEIVVEDFPQSPITLSYSDGSLSSKTPAMKRRRRQAPHNWPTSTKSTTHGISPYITTTPTTTTPTTTPPIQAPSLSKLPLQFSLLVDEPVPSCTLGQYLPKYLYPTPENGARIQAEVNKEVEIKVKAEASVSLIQDIVFSGPQGITKSHISSNEFAIKWTPGPDDLGQHYVICFVVEALYQSMKLHSDMRCFIVDVRHRIVETHVICSQSEMRVEVNKSTFPRLNEDRVRLSDPSNIVCSLKTHSNSTHIVAVFPLNACGTQIEEDNDYLKFKNEITTYDDSGEVITRKHLLEIQFYCQYPKRGNVTQGFLAHRNLTTVWEKGMGRFMYEFEFFPTAMYKTMINPDSYPLEYDLGKRIYMQIKATSSVENVELFVESCRAAPYDNPNSKPVYPIIENGCTVDPTVLVHSPAHTTKFQFSLEAFKFIGLHDQVFISCSVLMCRAGDPDTRCAKGCINPQPFLAGRRKRGLVTQSSLHHISQGPLCGPRTKRSLSPVINMNLNMIFIAGCLLAAVGMISGAAVYTVKISKMKYQRLPTQET